MVNVCKITKNKNFTSDPNTGQNRLAKGNQIGRMPKKGFTLTDLNKLIRKYESTKDITLLEHYIEQLHKDNKLLGRYMDKNIPTKTISELTGPGGSPIRYIIEKTYEKGEKGEKGKSEEDKT